MSSPRYVYHWVPIDMQGNTLYPLNMLKELHPSIYARQVSKYTGREQLLRRVIPAFDCLWNDVLHLCPLHPGKIFAKLREIGFDYPLREFFEIDLDSLVPDDDILVMEYPSDREERFYRRRNPDGFPGLAELPPATVQYYRECLEKKTDPLLFVYITHILYRGTLDISKCAIITV